MSRCFNEVFFAMLPQHTPIFCALLIFLATCRIFFFNFSLYVENFDHFLVAFALIGAYWVRQMQHYECRAQVCTSWLNQEYNLTEMPPRKFSKLSPLCSPQFSSFFLLSVHFSLYHTLWTLLLLIRFSNTFWPSKFIFLEHAIMPAELEQNASMNVMFTLLPLEKCISCSLRPQAGAIKG